MSAAPRLLITCDDLGYHPTFNQAIVEILAAGVVRCASIMPAGPHFDDALQCLAAAGLETAGVHLTLGSEYPALPVRPLNDPRRVPSLVQPNGCFVRDLTAQRDRLVPHEVAAELRSQIELARRSGLRLTHLDGHMFCYEPEVGGDAVLAIAESLAAEYALPLRRRAAVDPGFARIASRPSAEPWPVYMFWVGSDTVASRTAYYRQFFAAYADPIAELIIHPGADLAAMHAFSRTGERRLADYLFFRDPDWVDSLRPHGIEIVGWSDL